MLGLLVKDLRLTLTRKQTLLIFLVVALIMSMSMDGAFIIGYFTMLASIIAVGTISYDEFDNGFAFLMTMPFDRKTYVREKYLFSLIMAAAAWCFGAILYCIGFLIRHNAAAIAGELPALLAIIPAFYLLTAIMIPLQLKYGAEKSRIALYVIFGIVAVLIIGSNKIFGGTNILAALTATLDSMSPVVVLVTFALVCIAAAYASYLWSIRIMKKKEF